MTVAYSCVAAALLLSLAMVRHSRPAVSVPAVILVLATAAWNLTRVGRGPDDHEPTILAAATVLSVEIGAAAFFVMCRRLVHGRWRGPFLMWIAMVWFSTAIFLAMLPQLGLVQSHDYRESPIFAVHLLYTFGLIGAGVLTLNQRQHDQSRRVRRFVVATEVATLLTISLQVVEPSLAPFGAAALALLAVWTTARPAAWSRSASRADRLLNSIGVFIFVVERDGVLRDWNGPAASLLELVGTRAARGIDLPRSLGIPSSFIDGHTFRLAIQDGTLRVTLSVHEVDPLARRSDLVLMLRPVRSTVESSSFPAISGELQGHDPATQTLGRKAAVKLLADAMADGRPVLRVEVTTRYDRRPDETMFLLARRLEARAEEEGLYDLALARLDAWTFVALLPHTSRTLPPHRRYDDLDLEVNVSIHRRLPKETSESFVRRVEEDLGETAAALEA